MYLLQNHDDYEAGYQTMLQAKKAQIQPFTSINQSQSASKEEKPVTETIDVLLLYFLELTDTHEG